MTTEASGPAYAAPALEKGLDILELLAREGRPLGTRQIAEALGRSKNEIFRMLHVLVARGYLQRDPVSEGFSLSNMLFDLGMRTTRARDLVSVAAPIIEQLAHHLRQAVHLVVPHRGETVIIAASSGGSDLNFSLKLGYRRPLVDAHSGLVLLAHQRAADQERMLAESIQLLADPPRPDKIAADLKEVRRRGEIIAESRDILGLTDLCHPVLASDGTALACVTLVAVTRRAAPPDFIGMMAEVAAACRRISAEMRHGPAPVTVPTAGALPPHPRDI